MALLVCAFVVVLGGACPDPIRRDVLLQLHWPRDASGPQWLSPFFGWTVDGSLN